MHTPTRTACRPLSSLALMAALGALPLAVSAQQGTPAATTQTYWGALYGIIDQLARSVGDCRAQVSCIIIILHTTERRGAVPAISNAIQFNTYKK